MMHRGALRDRNATVINVKIYIGVLLTDLCLYRVTVIFFTEPIPLLFTDNNVPKNPKKVFQNE